MNQNFSAAQLAKLCKKTELIEIEATKKELLDALELTFESIINNTFQFQLIKQNNYVLASNIEELLVLRKLNDNVKRLYKDQQANRRIIISQIKNLLEETCNAWVLKTDIKSFYESIIRDRLLEKLQSDPLLSYHSLRLIKLLFNNPLILSQNGLPRGLAISATLSEIYMRKFDKWIRRYPGVYYYARFVDDIIVFANSKNTVEEIRQQLNQSLQKFAEGLIINEEKTSHFDINDIKPNLPLEYLGYKFIVHKKRKNEKTLIISIADKKIKKIKSRIIYSFLDFIKNKDFELLDKRIKFLTGNYSIRKSGSGSDLKAGIYYSYSNVTELKVFDVLNRFYQKALFSKQNSFGNKLSNSLNNEQKEKLNKYSFKHGFTKKSFHSFLAKEINQIKSCWK